MLDDFHVFYVKSGLWVDLSEVTAGARPSARSNHGFTTGNGRIYLYGGINLMDGEFLSQYVQLSG